MDCNQIKETLNKEYKINASNVERFRGSYKIYSGKDFYGLKVVNYDFEHFLFIIDAINHLKVKGSREVLDIIKTKEEKEYVVIDNKFCYLTKWIESRKSNYENREEFSSIVSAVGRLHRFSEGFTIRDKRKPRIYWFSWIRVFETRLEEILDFKNRISQKIYKDDFDKLYLSMIEEEIERGKKAILELQEGNYYEIMEEQMLKRGFCHHDLAHHNILINENKEITFIDFDYCILDSKIHDIASIIIRVMKDGNWNEELSSNIINSYKMENELSHKEINLMKGFIRFPQAFWQIGLQRYWEQQPWQDEVFLSKISKYENDIYNREKFIENFGGEG